MNQLIDGYHRFRSNSWPAQRKAFEELAKRGQSPNHMVLACIDSRVDPAMIFDTGPGELLTVRNVANLVPPYEPDAAYHGTSSAVEFGVQVLQVRHLIVLGHGLCGGIKALLDGTTGAPLEFTERWMSIAEPARKRALEQPDPEKRERCCEHDVVKVSLANLRTFPWVAERVAVGTLELHGAWFDVRTGLLMMLDPDGTFVPVIQPF